MTPSQNKFYSKSLTFKSWIKVIGYRYSIPILFFCTSMFSFFQIGIGTVHPHPSAEFEINPLDSGLQLEDSSTNIIWYFNNTNWVEIGRASISQSSI